MWNDPIDADYPFYFPKMVEIVSYDLQFLSCRFRMYLAIEWT